MITDMPTAQPTVQDQLASRLTLCSEHKVPAESEMIASRLRQRLLLRTDDDMSNLATVIGGVLNSTSVSNANAVNYAVWLDLPDPRQPASWFKLPLLGVERWLGPFHRVTLNMTAQVRQIVVDDCVAYAERVEAEQPLDLQAVIKASPGVQPEWASDIEQQIWRDYAAQRDIAAQSGPPSHAQILRWVTAQRLNATRPLESEEPTQPVWQPAGDGMENLRVQPAVMQAVDMWFGSHALPSSENTETVNSGPKVSEAITAIESVNATALEAYRAATWPYQAETPRAYRRIVTCWWLLLVAICLGFTAVSTMETWRVFAPWIPGDAGSVSLVFPIDTSPKGVALWATQNMLKTIGLLLICSVLSSVLGYAWARALPRLQSKTIRHWIRVGYVMILGCTLLGLAFMAADKFLLANQLYYRVTNVWWDAFGIKLVAACVLMALTILCFWNVDSVVHNWREATPKPLSLIKAVAQARQALPRIESLKQQAAQQGASLVTLESLQVKMNHLADMVYELETVQQV